MLVRSRLRLKVLACLGAVLLVTAACGGDDSSESDADVPTPASDGAASTQSPKGENTAAANGKTDPVAALKYKKGQNTYTITVDGLKRQFIVHVPSGYTPNAPVPLIFVFHMGAHNGGHAYATTKWREQCEKETCISVYPSAMKYFAIKENKNQATWNDIVAVDRVAPGTALADDVKFVQTIVDTLKATFNIDAKRIYASGASNGGLFVSSRILIDLPQIFAAAGINVVLPVTKGLPPKNNKAIPAYLTLGSRDPKFLRLLNEAGLPDKELPMEAAQIMQHSLLGTQLANLLKTLGLDPSYTVEYCAPKLNRCTATYSPALESAEGLYTTLTFARGGTPGIELRFRMIKGMGHAYATAANNPAHLDGAEYEYEFFMEHPKP